MRLVSICLLAVGLAQAAEPSRTVVIKAARMFDGKSVSAPGVVVVANGKILGAGAGAQIPSGAETLDLGDATLLPGFMDAHTHLSGDYTDDWKQAELDHLRKTIPERTLDALPGLRATLMAGFTTCRDLGSGDYVDVGLRNAVRSGKIVGPRMLVAVHSIGSTGGHCDTTGYRFGVFGRETGVQDGVINTADEARAAVRFNIKYGADVIKTCATGGVLSLADDVDTPQLTQEELNALVEEAHALRRKTAAHAHGATGAKRAIRAGIDSIEHGSFLDDEALDLMRSKGTYLIPTLMAPWWIGDRMEHGVYYPPEIAAKARLAIASINQMFRKAVAKGVKIGFGTDAAVYPHGRNAGEFALMVNLGMKPVDALKTATSVNAELLGVSDRLGTLEAGKLADVIAVPGDPTQDIHQTEKVFFVMKEGFVYRNDRSGGPVAKSAATR
ncbi:MAG: amidohydrolase family protein [Acidobacteriota bacterium]|nr:amidohydrolase family protein [Acidobacteriota bacterium]